MAARAEVHGAVVDVCDREAVAGFAASLAGRHGGVDIVFSNHYTRIQPDDDPAEMIDHYVAVNNLGTTTCSARSRRCCAMAPGCWSSRAGRGACARWHRFCTLASTVTWNHSTTSILPCARARRGPRGTRSRPGVAGVDQHSLKIGQVAAVRVLARQRRADDLRRGILVAAVCPGLIDTGASREWLDMTRAQTPAEAAAGLLDLALGPNPDPGFYGELVLFGKVVPWKPWLRHRRACHHQQASASAWC